MLEYKLNWRPYPDSSNYTSTHHFCHSTVQSVCSICRNYLQEDPTFLVVVDFHVLALGGGVTVGHLVDLHLDETLGALSLLLAGHHEVRLPIFQLLVLQGQVLLVLVLVGREDLL